MPNQAEIDGWKIRVLAPSGERTCWHGQAKDPMWHRYAEAFDTDKKLMLLKLADKTQIDPIELTTKFGV